MATNSLMTKMLKSASKDNKISMLSSSQFFDKDPIFNSSVPMINLMVSGEITGGIRPGVHLVCGDSRTFKTSFCLSLMKDFLDQKPNGIAIFADCEFGAKSSFAAFGIDEDRVLHIAMETIEDMKFKLVQALDQIEEGSNEEVFIFIDSLSQIASKKEVENALNENIAADMTRAREMNSFFRIITPKLQIKKIPLIAINSSYDSMTSVYEEKTIKGGKQVMLSSDVILMVTRSQVKDEKELKGWNFNYTCHKSRFVKEKAKFSLLVTYDGGIDQNSGLFDLAMEAGFLKSEKQGFYLFNIDGMIDGKSYRRKDIEANYSQFFDKLIKNEEFNKFTKQKYALESGELFQEKDVVDPDTGEITNG